MADELILTLDFETPPRADELGELFVALARDYRDTTKGRVLVVTRVESGSIIATLTDLALAALTYVTNGVAAVEAANALADFAKHLKEWFGHAKSDKGKHLYRKGKKSSGQRSVEAIVKIAASTGSRVRVKHRTEKGETLVVELTPTEAVKAREQAFAEKAEAVRTTQRPRDRAALPDVQIAIERLYHARVNNLSPTEAQAVVDVVVAVLQAAGAGHLLQEIASDLELRGLHIFAHAVRQHIRASGGGHEPPLTTT